MRNLLRGVLVAMAAVALLVPGSAFADDADQPNIKVRFLLQSQYQTTEDAAPSGDGWDNEMFLRRARIILAGNVNKWIHFFVETDNPNMGKNGNWAPTSFIQDAFVDFQFMKEFNVAAGMILLPFTHHNRQSAASLNTLDYHNLFSGRFVTDKVWRDAGIEARGIVANIFDYKVGIFNGLRGKAVDGLPTLNPDDMPRITGRVAINVFEPEEAFFYGGTYLGKKRVLQFGAGFDLQPGAILTDMGDTAMYTAVSGDAFLDLPLNDKMELTAQAAFVWFNRGFDAVAGADPDAPLTFTANKGSGYGAYGDIGFRYDFIQPTIGGEWFDSDVDSADLMNIRGGVQYWFKGHSANLKLEYAYLKTALGTDDEKGLSQITLQSQFLF